MDLHFTHILPQVQNKHAEQNNAGMSVEVSNDR